VSIVLSRLRLTFGLRDYGTAQWDGGDKDCQHIAERSIGASTLMNDGRPNPGILAHHKVPGVPYRSVCGKCGARRIDAQIGLEATPDEYIAQMVAVFREVRRVLRPDGTLWLNLGDSYASGTKGSGGATLKQATNVGSFFEARQFGMGDAKPKDLMLMPARVALALQADGWFVRSQMPWIKRSCMPESTTDRPTSAIEYVYLLTKSPCYFWDAQAVAREGAIPAGTLAAKGSAERAKHANGRPPEYAVYSGTRNFRNSDLFFDSLEPPYGMILSDGEPLALDVNPAAFNESHFATFPPRLVEPLIRAGTSERGCCAACGAPWQRMQARTAPDGRSVIVPAGQRHAVGDDGEPMMPDNRIDAGVRGSFYAANGVLERTTTGWAPTCQCDAAVVPCTVLDPFSGAATTLVVADRLQRHAIGIELSPEYCAMARRRLEADAGMFAEVEAA